MVILLLLFIAQFPLSSLIVQARLAIGQATDRRLNLVNKLIVGIQTIKNYVWEEPIIHRIQSSRRVECRRLLRVFFWKGFSDGIFRNANLVLSFPVILVPLAHGQPLVASTIFTALSLLENIALNSVKTLNFAMNAMADYYSVIKRAEQVLLLEDKESQPHSDELQLPLRVVVKGLTTSWKNMESAPSDIKEEASQKKGA